MSSWPSAAKDKGGPRERQLWAELAAAKRSCRGERRRHGGAEFPDFAGRTRRAGRLLSPCGITARRAPGRSSRAHPRARPAKRADRRAPRRQRRSFATSPIADAPAGGALHDVRRSQRRGSPAPLAPTTRCATIRRRLVAIRAAAEVGAEARFIDLTFPSWWSPRRATQKPTRPTTSAQTPTGGHRSRACRTKPDRATAVCLAAAWSAPARATPTTCGTASSSTIFGARIGDVLPRCARVCAPGPARLDARDARRRRDRRPRGRDGRRRRRGRAGPGAVVVVTGGFHTVALPHDAGRGPSRCKWRRPTMPLVALMRYGFEQLDRLNGYASGMPSPEFYQRTWEGEDLEDRRRAARECRKRRDRHLGRPTRRRPLEHARRLAGFGATRGRRARTCSTASARVFIKGADDVEGVAVLAPARKLLAGDRVGERAAGRRACRRSSRTSAHVRAGKLSLDVDRDREVTLDLYRSQRTRQESPSSTGCGSWRSRSPRARGPDYVAGEHLERVQEVWKYRWSPMVESSLIEQARTARRSKRRRRQPAAGAVRRGRAAGRRADIAARLVIEACRMGCMATRRSLVTRTAALVAGIPLPPRCRSRGAAMTARLPRAAGGAAADRPFAARRPSLGSRGAADAVARDDAGRGRDDRARQLVHLDGAVGGAARSRARGHAAHRELARARGRRRRRHPPCWAARSACSTATASSRPSWSGGSAATCAATSDATHGARFFRGVLRAARSVLAGGVARRACTRARRPGRAAFLPRCRTCGWPSPT